MRLKSLNRHLLYSFFLLLSLQNGVASGKLPKAFEALKIYDYFKAKELFYKQLKYNDPCARYGLALIYYRNDNPFHQLDSALKYCTQGFNHLNNGSTQTFSGFTIDRGSLSELCDSISSKIYAKIEDAPDILLLEKFLHSAYLANPSLLEKAFNLRDELEYEKIIRFNKSDSTRSFIITHPQSKLVKDASFQYDRQLFEEQTSGSSIEEYFTFLKRNPNNNMINSSYEKLFELCRKNSDVKNLKRFIDEFPNSPQYNEAWKLLFSLSVHTFNNEELQSFLNEYPRFPFKNSILKELELNKISLYPYEKEELFGYINEKGELRLKIEYETATAFQEGLAVVSKNDSVFYINKENSRAFDSYYEEAFSFRNGLAPVKKNGVGLLINRQGQTVQTFEEINEISDDIYIMRTGGKYGAMDAYGKILFEPQFDKIGDFKNGAAYYSNEGKYGFLTKQGLVFKAEYEWISDFSETGAAIIKQGNLYGIINTESKKILESEYDQIVKCSRDIYLVIKNNFYGFFHLNGCFLAPVNFDYMRDKPAEFYSNGNWLRLIKKNEAMVDQNGKVQIEKNDLEEMNFPSCGLIKAKKKSKFGYLDKKLNIAIPFKYTTASDFIDSTAIVTLKEQYLLIDIHGKELFRSDEKIEYKASGIFLCEAEDGMLLNKKGEVLFKEVNQVQNYNNHLLIITLNNGQIKLLRLR